jgi:hypothetical protein
MSDVSNPLLSCDADVVGSDAASNNNSMHVDIDNNVTGKSTHSHSPRRSLAPQSPASAMSGFLSMIEYATMPVLIDIANRHKVHLPLRIRTCMLNIYRPTEGLPSTSPLNPDTP